MAKPIFIMTLAIKLSDFKQFEQHVQYIEEKLSDYHVLINVDSSLKESKYQLFSDKEIEPIKIDELKKLIFETYTSNAPIE